MHAYLLEFLPFLLLLLILVPLLGGYIANIFLGKQTFMHPLLQPLENLLYRLAGINSQREMHWISYAKAMLMFNFIGFLFLFGLQLAQGWLPLNPENFPAVPLPLAFNTAISFVTNTNWQAYAGETTMSYLTQMLGLCAQNFFSPATGLATLITLTRSFTRKDMNTIGNFWQDFTRAIVYLLLPLAFVFAIFLAQQGLIQNFSAYVRVKTLENHAQTIPFGPVASQVAIKQLGSNGGGFFNTNSAHPFENPTDLSNFFQMLALILIPASLVYAFGILISSKHQGYVPFVIMFSLWLAGTLLSIYAEIMPNPVLFDYTPVLEGKEVRHGILSSAIWNATTSAAANGSINNQLASISPLAGGIALFNIAIGEIFFGAIGTGLCGMIFFILLTVFLSGLMVGRTPEYLGKKIEKKEIQWTVLAVLSPAALILIGAGLTMAFPSIIASAPLNGPRGLSSIVYAFASAARNNGSAFNSLDTSSTYYNLVLAIVMLLGRIGILLPSVAVAGLIARKKTVPSSPGTLNTNTWIFTFLLMATILVMGGLIYFPVLTLGALLEHMLMLRGYSF